MISETPITVEDIFELLILLGFSTIGYLFSRLPFLSPITSYIALFSFIIIGFYISKEIKK